MLNRFNSVKMADCLPSHALAKCTEMNTSFIHRNQ